jgi:pyruvate/2-oxoglutarate dehydrogenase complex dihydrolipoamide acyltransferase (E2) component
VTDGLDGLDGIGAAAFDSGQGEQPGLPSVQRAGRRPRFGLVAGLAAIVVVVCVVAGVLVAALSGSSNSTKVPPSRQASPPASTAPAPPPSPLKLVSNDQQGAVYNVNSSQLAVSAVANGRVWLEVIAGSGPSGQVLWQGVLSDGQTQTITNSAPVWMRIGASSNVTVSVNGGGVLLPQSPTTYNLTFSQGQV